jgi:hypothetical protein
MNLFFRIDDETEIALILLFLIYRVTGNTSDGNTSGSPLKGVIRCARKKWFLSDVKK